MVPLIGLIALVPLTLRVTFFGVRRELPRRWLAGVPALAPVAWLLGCAGFFARMRSMGDRVTNGPKDERVAALALGISDSLRWVFGGGVAALVLLVACYVLFSQFTERSGRRAG